MITVAARPDAVNRLRPALRWLDEQYSEFLIGDAVIVLTEQVQGAGKASIDHVRTYLGKWVREVVTVPFDGHLAAGDVISWHRLAAPTRDAYLRLLGCCGERLAARTHVAPLGAGPAGTSPLVWLVGVHGGAGVTSLAASMSWAGDAGGAGRAASGCCTIWIRRWWCSSRAPI